MKVKIFGIMTLFCICFGGGTVLAQHNLSDLSKDEMTDIPKYSYYYKEKLIHLNPSKRFVAIQEEHHSLNAFVNTNNLRKDPLSDHEALKNRGVGLYRRPKIKDETANQLDLDAQIRSSAQIANQIIQPVFEQGPNLLIPADEIIIGFKEDTDLDDAQTYLSPHMHSQGIIDLSAFRKNTFILKIADPADGRVYEVCRFLAGLEAVRFAEPNHIILMLTEPEIGLPHDQYQQDQFVDPQSNVTSPSDYSSFSEQAEAASTAVGWTVLIDENFENEFLPAGWTTGRYVDYSYVSWSVTDYRSHAGNGSCYASGGWTQGVSPPGPYPHNAKSWLDTPVLYLAAYQEVYVEFWFYARYEDPSDSQYDFGSVHIYDTDSGMGNFLGLLAIAYAGDLTEDPTTDNGWRRALFRIPPNRRSNGVKVRFLFESDGSIAREGLYIDQVRILGTTDVDTATLGNDTYGSRQYELKNMGQIAGLGDDSNDMNVPAAWAILKAKGHNQPVSADITVAVIDSGVDLDHPDLNLTQGYDSDGLIGGNPRTAHGTAVAGNIGAIRNNSVGVIGTAPSAKILPIYYGDDNGITPASLADAIHLAVSKGARILNNSWILGTPYQVVEDAINDALKAGRIVLFGAGNGPDRKPWSWDVRFPCKLTASTDVICVGATSPTDEHKDTASSDGRFGWGSSYKGAGPDICAPGSWSYTTDLTGAEGYNDGSKIDPDDPSSADYTPDFSGTSSSTPKVAGIVALMLTADPDLTPKEVKRILRETADDIEAPGVDDKTGAGRVDAFEAVFYLLYRPMVVTESAGDVTPGSAVLNGVVNPNGFRTTYYFEYGQDETYGYRTSALDAGSGTDDLSVDVRVTIADKNARYHFRLVAENTVGISFGRDKAYGYDTDADSLPDEWERDYFGNLRQRSAGDYDRDALTNFEEYKMSTDPTDSDTDSDGIPDGRDAFPNNPKEWKDTDEDGIGDNADPDDDNDGMPDMWEKRHGLNPVDDDALEDLDGDTVSNIDEYEEGTNPDNLPVEAFIIRFYRLCLNRNPDQAGLDGWVDSLTEGSLTGSDVAHGFVFSSEFLKKNTNNEAYLNVLYQAFFNRDPDATGWTGWLSQLYSGVDRKEVLNGFIYSQEFNRLCWQYGMLPNSVAAFVSRFYRQCLERKAEKAGLDRWTNDLLNQIRTGAEVAEGFIYSPEFINKNTSNEAYLTILYRAFFNRGPDPAGWALWLAELYRGTNREFVLNGFIYAREFAELCDKFCIRAFEGHIPDC
jgi:subtilisin family serine protease